MPLPWHKASPKLPQDVYSLQKDQQKETLQVMKISHRSHLSWHPCPCPPVCHHTTSQSWPFPPLSLPDAEDRNSGEESVRAGVQQPRTTHPCTGDLTTCMPFTGPAHKNLFVLPENLVKFFWRIWLESVVLTVADNQTPRYPPPSPRVRAPGEGGVFAQMFTPPTSV